MNTTTTVRFVATHGFSTIDYTTVRRFRTLAEAQKWAAIDDRDTESWSTIVEVTETAVFGSNGRMVRSFTTERPMRVYG